MSGVFLLVLLVQRCALHAVAQICIVNRKAVVLVEVVEETANAAVFVPDCSVKATGRDKVRDRGSVVLRKGVISINIRIQQTYNYNLL
jgi:hypothetical protein